METMDGSIFFSVIFSRCIFMSNLIVTIYHQTHLPQTVAAALKPSPTDADKSFIGCSNFN